MRSSSAESIAAGAPTEASSAFRVHFTAANPIATGVTPPLDWAKPGPVPGSPRIVQIYGTPLTLDPSGQLVSSSHSWYSGFAGASDVTCCSS